MSQYPSRLSRNDLYSYGFKEGQPWGEDRRALESALRAMDQLERDIQQNYIYNKAVPSNPWMPCPVSTTFSRAYKEAIPRTHYHSQAFPRPSPDIYLNRSNTSEASQSESSSSGSEMAHWSGRPNDYSYPGYVNGQSGRPQRHYHSTPQDNPPVTFHRPVMAQMSSSQGRSGPSNNIYAPPLSASNSRYSQFHGSKTTFPEEPTFYHPKSPPTSPHSPTHPSQPFGSSSQLQLVRYQDGHGEDGEHQMSSHYTGTPPSSPSALSPGWSMSTTRGTGSENLSMGSSGSGVYSEDYHPPVASSHSGYAESYNVRSYPSYLDYRDTVEDLDQDYMSDGVASDEGVYYSSSEGPEDDDDDEAVFSDGGYSEDYDDYSYDDSD